MENRSAKNSADENSQADNSQSQKENSQSRADKLEERLTDFAVRIVRLSGRLPGVLQENISRDRF